MLINVILTVLIFYMIFYLILNLLNIYLSKICNIPKLNSFYIFFICFLLFTFTLLFINNFWQIQVLDFKIRNFNNTIKINKIAEMKVPRSFHKMSFLSDSQILITGGYGKNGKILNSTEILDIKTKKITYGPQMNKPHCNHIQITAKNGDIYVIDSNGIELLEKNNQDSFKLIYNGFPEYNSKKDLRLHKFSYKIINEDSIFVYDKKNRLLIDTKQKKIIDNPKIKNAEKEENNNINYQTFKLNNNEYISFIFMYSDKDYTLDSYIKIFDNNGLFYIYNTFIQPFCAILKLNNNQFIISGGEDIKNNFKFNPSEKKYWLEWDMSRVYYDLNVNGTPPHVEYCKDIYKVEIKGNKEQ